MRGERPYFVVFPDATFGQDAKANVRLPSANFATRTSLERMDQVAESLRLLIHSHRPWFSNGKVHLNHLLSFALVANPFFKLMMS